MAWRAGALGAAVPRGFKLTHDASISLATVHEDEHMIGICKPAGVPAHPSPGTWEGGTVAHALVGRVPAAMLEERGNHDETDSFIPKCIVHRLDAGTSGVMVIAKTPLAVRRLTDQMRTADAPAAPSSSAVGSKVYVALLLGHPGGVKRETSITIDGAIGRDPENPREWCVTPTGKHAKTVVRVHGYDEKSGVALVTAELFSGRTHQIRVHCAHVGAPVASDGLYAPKAANDSFRRLLGKALPPRRQLLHAWALNLQHPARLGANKHLAIRAPLPEDLGKVVKQLFPKMGLDPCSWPGVPERLALGAVAQSTEAARVAQSSSTVAAQKEALTAECNWNGMSASSHGTKTSVEAMRALESSSTVATRKPAMSCTSVGPSGMMFWGGIVEPGEEHRISFPAGELLRVSQACIAPDALEGSRARLMLEREGLTYSLARLKEGSAPLCALDLFLDMSRVNFIVKGKAAVHLTGYFEPGVSGPKKQRKRRAMGRSEKDNALPPKKRRLH